MDQYCPFSCHSLTSNMRVVWGPSYLVSTNRILLWMCLFYPFHIFCSLMSCGNDFWHFIVLYEKVLLFLKYYLVISPACLLHIFLWETVSNNSLLTCLIPLMILPLHHLPPHFFVNIPSVSSCVSSPSHLLCVFDLFWMCSEAKSNKYLHHFICEDLRDLWQNRVPLLFYIPFIIIPKMY